MLYIKCSQSRNYYQPESYNRKLLPSEPYKCFGERIYASEMKRKKKNN